MQAPTGPEPAEVVTFDGQGGPVVTDGPFPEAARRHQRGGA
ncbi:hypothetical protein [Actinophytocola sp.]